MKGHLKKFVSAVLVCCMANTGIVFSNYSLAQSPDPDFNGNNIVLRFGVLSDIHATQDNATNTEIATSRYEKAANLLLDYSGRELDAVMFCGDYGSVGSQSEAIHFAEKTKENFTYTDNNGQPVMPEFIFAYGNHDTYWGNDINVSGWYQELAAQNLVNYEPDSDFAGGNYHMTIGGYHFLSVEPLEYAKTVNGRMTNTYSAETVLWLDGMLETITASKPNRSVFIATHPPIENKSYGGMRNLDPGAEWASTKLGNETDINSVLSKYSQAVVFTGHTHYDTSLDIDINQDRYTTINTGAVIGSVLYGGEKMLTPENSNVKSGGIYVEIDSNGNLRITRLDFSGENANVINEPWIISAPCGNRLSEYTAARGNIGTPEFQENAELEITSYTSDSISFTFPSAVSEALVYKYVYNIYNGYESEPVYSTADISNWYEGKANIEDTHSNTITYSEMKFPLRLEVIPVDEYGNIGKPLTAIVGQGVENGEPEATPVGNINYASNLITTSWGAGKVNYHVYGEIEVEYAQNNSNAYIMGYMDKSISKTPYQTPTNTIEETNYTCFGEEDSFVMGLDYNINGENANGGSFELFFRKKLSVAVNSNGVYLLENNREVQRNLNGSYRKIPNGRLTVSSSPNHVKVWINGELYIDSPVGKYEPRWMIYTRALDLSVLNLRAYYSVGLSNSIPSIVSESNLTNGMKLSVNGNIISSGNTFGYGGEYFVRCDDKGVICDGHIVGENSYTTVVPCNSNGQAFSFANNKGYYLSADYKVIECDSATNGVKLIFADNSDGAHYIMHIYETLIILTDPSGREIKRVSKQKRYLSKSERIDAHITANTVSVWLDGNKILDNFTYSSAPSTPSLAYMFNNIYAEVNNIHLYYDEETVKNQLSELINTAPSSQGFYSNKTYGNLMSALILSEKVYEGEQSCELYIAYNELSKAINKLAVEEPIMPPVNINHMAYGLRTFSWLAGITNYDSNNNFVGVDVYDENAAENARIRRGDICFYPDNKVNKILAEMGSYEFRSHPNENHTCYNADDTFVYSMDYNVSANNDNGCYFNVYFRNNAYVRLNGLSMYLIIDGVVAKTLTNTKYTLGETGKLTILSAPNEVKIWNDGVLVLEYSFTEARDPRFYINVAGIEAEFRNLTSYYYQPKFETMTYDLTAAQKIGMQLPQNNSFTYADGVLIGTTAESGFSSQAIITDNNGASLEIGKNQNYYFSADINVSQVIQGESNGVKIGFRAGYMAHIYDTKVYITGPSGEIKSVNRSLKRTLGRTERINIYSTPKSVTIWLDGVIIIDNLNISGNNVLPEFILTLRQTNAKLDNVTIYSKCDIGDINGDGLIMADDIAVVTEDILGNYTGYDTAELDINKDKIFDLRDLVKIKKLAVR